MDKLRGLARRYGLNAVLLLVAVAMALLVYVVVTNGQFSQDVARERAQSIRAACVAQNARNVNTKAALDTLVRKYHPNLTASQRAGEEQPTDLLINALAPYQNCAKVQARATSTQ